MTKTLVYILGSNTSDVYNILNMELSKERYSIYISPSNGGCTKEHMLNIFRWYDTNPAFDDLIFVISDPKSSQWFIDNKYDEKVLLKDTTDSRKLHAPSITWSSLSELPSLVERLERNISEHANF